MRRRSTLPFLLFTAAAALWACGTKDLPHLTVGVIAELSGDIPAVGASCKNAAEMALGELNEDGVKVAGKKHLLRLTIEDSKGTAGEAVEAARRLAKEDNVLAIVGPNASLGAVPASQLAEDAKVPMISPWYTNPKTTPGQNGSFP